MFFAKVMPTSTSFRHCSVFLHVGYELNIETSVAT